MRPVLLSRTRSLFAVATLAALITVGVDSSTSQASFITYSIDSVINAPSPQDNDGSGKWLFIKIEDLAANTVKITMTSNLESDSPYQNQHIQEVYLNYTGSSTLTFGAFATTGTSVVSAPAFVQGTPGSPLNPLQGDGTFDLLFDFANGAPGGAVPGPSFGGTEEVSFTLTGAGLDYTDFDARSEKPQGQGRPFGFYAGMFVGGIGPNDGSGSSGDDDGDDNNNQAVPVPPTILMAAFGLVPFAGAAGIRRLRRKAA